MKKVAAFLLVQFCAVSLFCQNLHFAQKTIDTLTSQYFSGRGAVNDGEKKAAHFIANQFEEIGLKTIKNSFLQEFNAPINTFPKELKVTIDGKKLTPGVDFIVDPSTNQTEESFELFWLPKKHASNQDKLHQLANEGAFTNKFVVLDLKNAEKEIINSLKTNTINAAGIIFITEKLTHSLSSKVRKHPTLYVKKGVIATNSQRISVKIDQQFKPNYQSQNVIGCVQGTQFPDSIILLSAHYDHLGMMGENTYFPGANDNASGVAMLLDMANYYAKNPPKKSIIFIAFGAEELGLVGSKYFVNHPTVPLHNINFVFNMDLMGTGSEGGMIVNGKVFEQHFNKLDSINQKESYLPMLKKRGKAANSDHYWFSENGIPSFFIYLMGGISAYHDVDDVAKTLPLTKYEASFRLICNFIDEL